MIFGILLCLLGEWTKLFLCSMVHLKHPIEENRNVGVILHKNRTKWFLLKLG